VRVCVWTWHTVRFIRMCHLHTYTHTHTWVCGCDMRGIFLCDRHTYIHTYIHIIMQIVVTHAGCEDVTRCVCEYDIWLIFACGMLIHTHTYMDRGDACEMWGCHCVCAQMRRVTHSYASHTYTHTHTHTHIGLWMWHVIHSHVWRTHIHTHTHRSLWRMRDARLGRAFTSR